MNDFQSLLDKYAPAPSPRRGNSPRGPQRSPQRSKARTQENDLTPDSQMDSQMDPTMDPTMDPGVSDLDNDLDNDGEPDVTEPDTGELVPSDSEAEVPSVEVTLLRSEMADEDGVIGKVVMALFAAGSSSSVIMDFLGGCHDPDARDGLVSNVREVVNRYANVTLV